MPVKRRSMWSEARNESGMVTRARRRMRDVALVQSAMLSRHHQVRPRCRQGPTFPARNRWDCACVGMARRPLRVAPRLLGFARNSVFWSARISRGEGFELPARMPKSSSPGRRDGRGESPATR